ncbi:MAG: hypothetical protein H0X40_15130 [Chthoniobacterales bacterium]|nr:hypothetical protein [Chthoniobacterales bacterium]
MKLSVQVNVMFLAGMICLFASLFQKPIGLPNSTRFVTPLLGALFIVAAVWLPRRAKKCGDVSIIVPTRPQYNKRIRLILICGVVGSLSAPLYLRYGCVVERSPQSTEGLTWRCRQRLPDVRPRFPMTTTFSSALCSLPVGMADLVLVRRFIKLSGYYERY